MKKIENMIFYVYCLFRNDKLRNDMLGNTIKKIVEHQLSQEVISSDKVGLALNHIIEQLTFTPQKHVLEDEIQILYKNIPVLEEGVLSNQAITRALCIKLICDYLDWDWTFNTFIVEKSNDKSDFFILVLGMLGINAWISFGFIESVSVIFERMEELMEKENNIIAYYFVKAYKPNKAEEWKRRIGIIKERFIELVLY